MIIKSIPVGAIGKLQSKRISVLSLFLYFAGNTSAGRAGGGAGGGAVGGAMKLGEEETQKENLMNDRS